MSFYKQNPHATESSRLHRLAVDSIARAEAAFDRAGFTIDAAISHPQLENISHNVLTDAELAETKQHATDRDMPPFTNFEDDLVRAGRELSYAVQRLRAAAEESPEQSVDNRVSRQAIELKAHVARWKSRSREAVVSESGDDVDGGDAGEDDVACEEVQQRGDEVARRLSRSP